VNYRFNNRNNIYANAGHFTRPPFLRNSFQDARYSNQYRLGLDTEKIYSAELGYSYKSPYLKANFNAYYLIWQDRTTEINLENPDENVTADIPLVLTGMVSRHMGVELDFVVNPISTLEINGYVSIGDWTWAEVPNQLIQFGNEIIETDDAFAVNTVEGLPVGFAAQTTAGMGFHYRGIRSTYIGGRMNYADRIPIGYQLEDVADGFINADVIRDEFDSYYTVDIYAGRYFDVGEKMSGRISLAVNNILDEQYVRWANFFNQQTQRAYGFPRTYTVALTFNF
jgi:outer membrane receptor protein involved in Fe transport